MTLNNTSYGIHHTDRLVRIAKAGKTRVTFDLSD